MPGETGATDQQAPQGGVPGPAPGTRWPRPLLVAGVLLAAVGAALWLRNESQPRERDYHAVKSEFERIERKIHDRDIGFWLVVEGEPHEEGAGAAAREERHRRILDDFGNLAHGGNFAMTDVDIKVDGERAHLRYALQSWPEPWRPMPRGGTMEFVRRQGRWVLDDHRFADER